MTDSHSIAMEAKTNNRRFSVLHLIVGTAIAAVYCAALFNESPWWRATLGTITLAMLLNSALAAIYATGLKRVFAVGFLIGAIFFVLGIYSSIAEASLPVLLTTKLLEWLQALSIRIQEKNYLLVASIFWLQATCLASGYAAIWWHKSHRH